MKAQVLYGVAGVMAMAALAAAVSSEPTQAQSGGRWIPAGVYNTEAGGEVWMVNPDTGMARNCYWTNAASGGREIRCTNSRTY